MDEDEQVELAAAGSSATLGLGALAAFIMLMAGTCKGCEFADVEIERRRAVVKGCECPTEAAP